MSDNGWLPIESAPRGTYRETPMANGKMRRDFVPQWIDTWKPGGVVIRTYWLPDAERWNGYSKDYPPTHWHPTPLPPTLDGETP